MAYEKQTWVTGETITAQKLNHMEDGIASGGGSFPITLIPTGADTGTIDKTYSEILTALESGKIPIMNLVVNDEYKQSYLFNRLGTNFIQFLTTEYIPDENDITVRVMEVYVESDNTVYIGQVEYTVTLSNS